MILAFSCGLLISLLCFDLMKVALDTGGIAPALSGFSRPCQLCLVEPNDRS